MTTHALPTDGEVRIGSSDACHVKIEGSTISPVHAMLRLGSQLTITHCGAKDSVVEVGGNRLSPSQTVVLSPGVVVVLGGIAIVVQSSPASARLRHVRSHDYFEDRLEDECLRADAKQTSFAVARVKFSKPQAHALEAALLRHLRPLDLIAMYAGNEYELLLVDASPSEARELCSLLETHVAASCDTAIRIGLALWPHHGRSPESLLAAADPRALDDMSVKLPSVPVAGALEAMQPILERVAPLDVNVLILGETGVGKEVLARRIHALSPRSHLPMVCINCAALPETLLESVLFGHERGAFTGANTSNVGLLESARGGTVLLDEVAEIPISLQAKLLRVVEERQVRRLGGTEARSIKARFLAATNRDVEAEVSLGRFRQDLYFRLCGISLVVPPLRERIGEIELLANSFIAQCCAKCERVRVPHLTTAALRALQRYAWPGNIRELRNAIERAMILSTGDEIDLCHLPMERLGRHFTSIMPVPLRVESRGSQPPRVGSGGAYVYTRNGDNQHQFDDVVETLDESVAALECERVAEALHASGGNQTKAAELLGISRGALLKRIHRYGLPRPRKH